MKYILFFSIIFISFSVFAQSKKEKKDIKLYKIKSVTETVTEYENGKESVRKDSYIVYDKNANILQNEEYKRDGTLKHKEVNKYDSQENRLEQTLYEAPKPEKNVKYVCKYDMDDNKVEELQYDPTGKLVSKTQYSYSPKGNRTVEVSFDPAGKLIKKVVYAYDTKGLKVEKKEFNNENKLILLRKYEYQF